MRSVAEGDAEEVEWSFSPNEARALSLVWLVLPFSAAAFSFVSHSESRGWLIPAFVLSFCLASPGERS